MPHRLLGSEVSLYTGKARAYLRYKGIPFEEVLSSREVYEKLIVPRTGVRFIPVLITDDDVAIQDTTDIIDALEQRYPSPPIYPATPVQRLVSLLFEIYGDEWLVIPAMHYRWNIPENRDFAYGEFGRTTAPDAPPAQQQKLGELLAARFAGALPYLGVTDNSAPAIERSYRAFLSEFEAHLKQTPYLLGSGPSIGDFGLIGPLYAHLYRDPASGKLMRERAPRVAQWVTRMQHGTAGEGGFLADDQVPPTLLPMLRRMFMEQVPVIMDTAARLATWAGETETDQLKRTLGQHTFTVEGVSEQRHVYPYCLWMWQRAHDHYQAMAESDRARADRLLRALPGAITALSAPLPARVKRVDNRLRLAAH